MGVRIKVDGGKGCVENDGGNLFVMDKTNELCAIHSCVRMTWNSR